ncbi:MAG: ABC transporter permease subunit [Phycisphaeraceae bacterium]|nr:ABC transporter permease subunit [Phycisphaeraceae bacterium]
MVTADGDQFLAIWDDGRVARFAAAGGDREAPLVLMESARLSDPGHTLGSAALLIGGRSVVVGDDAGRLGVWFVVHEPTSTTNDRRVLTRARTIRVGRGVVSGLAVGDRDRLVLARTEGWLRIVHSTSGKLVTSTQVSSESTALLAFSPKGDGFLHVAPDGRCETWSLEAGYPGLDFGTLFGRVHYEGRAQPEFVYQSTASNDAPEPKLSLVPLIFGTLKATVFAMLFAVPVAVLAAIYTSEFLKPRARRVVKPTVELMATMPSVVLGFVAAVVIAPFVREHLIAVLLVLGCVPIAVMVVGMIISLLPERFARNVRGPKLAALLVVAVVLGIGVSITVDSTVERALFAPSRNDQLVRAGSFEVVPQELWPGWVGERQAMSPDESRRLRRSGFYFMDGQVVQAVEPLTADGQADVRGRIARQGLARPNLQRWLDGEFGGAFPGWVALLPFPMIVLAWLFRRLALDARINAAIDRASRRRVVLVEVARIVGTLAVGAGLTIVGAAALSAIGLDPRDSVLGPFTPLNTVVVAIVMAVAIIPIIYTISEDALRSVPQGLRLASLGAGATPWQTAIRVVLPVAGSGVFSACMIGLGRAVGETMIVLMATGGTPEMSWNVFSGFRTLSANIAMELPEAPKGTAHFRVLFLCGLVLFLMTFVINTSAEVVRQRFRRRSAAL